MNATDQMNQLSDAAVRIVRGEPSPEELAALVAVLAARASADAGEPAPTPPPSGWTDRSRYVRSGHTHQPGGWRAASFPR